MVAEFVEWVDSQSPDGPWVSPDDLDGTVCRCYSVGYIARDDEETLTLAISYHADETGRPHEWGHPLVIPKVAIVRRFRVPVV